MPGHADEDFDAQEAAEEAARQQAAEQAKKPLDERIGVDLAELDLVKNKEEAREQEAMRWEAIANTQLEAAETMERAVEEFGNHVSNLEDALRNDRSSRREYR